MMEIVQRSGGNHVLESHQKTLPGTGIKKPRLDGHRNTLFGNGRQKSSFGTGIKKPCLDGRQNTLFGWAWKYFVWTGVEICLFGPESKNWTLDFFRRASKNFFWEVKTSVG